MLIWRGKGDSSMKLVEFTRQFQIELKLEIACQSTQAEQTAGRAGCGHRTHPPRGAGELTEALKPAQQFNLSGLESPSNSFPHSTRHLLNIYSAQVLLGSRKIENKSDIGSTHHFRPVK